MIAYIPVPTNQKDDMFHHEHNKVLVLCSRRAGDVLRTGTNTYQPGNGEGQVDMLLVTPGSVRSSTPTLSCGIWGPHVTPGLRLLSTKQQSSFCRRAATQEFRNQSSRRKA